MPVTRKRNKRCKELVSQAEMSYYSERINENNHSMTRSSLIYPLLLGVIIISFVSCADTSKGTYPQHLLRKQRVDSSVIAIIPYTDEWFSPGKTMTPATLTLDDLKKVEFLLKSCVRRNNFIDLKKGNYKRQYVPVINDKGEKIVWINCFCDDGIGDWKTSIVMVRDGGFCYFHLKVNLTKGEYFDFWVNGFG